MAANDAPPRVDLFTRALGAASGTSRAALDILFALSHAPAAVRVFTWGLPAIPRELDGQRYGAFRIEPIRMTRVLRAVAAREAPPRSPWAQAWLRLRDVRAGRAASSAAPALELVNGLGAHRLAERARAAPAAQRALIVHESPRHFGVSGGRELQGAIADIRSYDFHVFVSERGRDEWGALANLAPERSLYIPNCVQEQRVLTLLAHPRGEVARALGQPTDLVRAVCLGTLSPRKGQDVVLEALGVLAAGAQAQQLRVDFVGPDQAGFGERLARRARALGVAHQVRFVGAVTPEQAYARMYAADVALLASRAEAFPLATLEAMALGTCVIASDVDGVPEQVVDAYTGLLFPSGDAVALAQRLQRVLDQPEQRAAFGAAGRARYLAEFTRARHVERWARAVAHMTSAGSRAPRR